MRSHLIKAGSLWVIIQLSFVVFVSASSLAFMKADDLVRTGQFAETSVFSVGALSLFALSFVLFKRRVATKKRLAVFLEKRGYQASFLGKRQVKIIFDDDVSALVLLDYPIFDAWPYPSKYMARAGKIVFCADLPRGDARTKKLRAHMEAATLSRTDECIAAEIGYSPNDPEMQNSRHQNGHVEFTIPTGTWLGEVVGTQVLCGYEALSAALSQ